MRRFLLYFSVFCGIVLLLCLLPGTQRLFGSEEAAPLPEPVGAAREMPVLLVAGSATEQRHWEEARLQPAAGYTDLCPQPEDGQAERRTLAVFHDANGNALSRRSYRHSVYQTFILGDMMG